MASPQLLSFPSLTVAEEEAIIKKRLQTQTTVARLNADPPLKKVAKRCVRPTSEANTES